jgi:integrase/recombinase XerD
MDRNEDSSPLVIPSALPVLTDAFVAKEANPFQSMLVMLDSKHSRRAYTSHLKRVGRLFGYALPAEVPWQSLRYDHLIALRNWMTIDEKRSPATINATLAAIRAVCRAAFNLSLMDADQLQRLCNVKMVRADYLPKGREVKFGELEALMRVCVEDHTPAGPRDAAIIGLLVVCGLRRSEIAELTIERVHTDEGFIRVVGKGNKERDIYPDAGTWAALDDWQAHRLADDGYLFCRIRRGGHIQYGRGLSDQAIYNVVQRRASEGALQHCSPHDFRKSFVTELLRQNVDVFVVQRMAGHSNVATTGRYDLRGAAVAKLASERLHLPYRSLSPSAPREPEGV